jgi:opacity protein-like surface antigen
MRKLLLGSALAFAFVAPASADVVIQDMLSGTGDNVIFDSVLGNTAIGSFNGMHTGLVDFTDLSNNSAFIGAANGNDIKISNTSDLKVVVKDSTNTNVLTTSTQVFSLKGSGDVTAFVQATDGLFTFDLGALSANAQSGFTLDAINGETMSSLILLDTGGTISDYEHYRIDVAGPLVTTPLPAGLPLFAGGLGLMGWLSRRRKRS